MDFDRLSEFAAVAEHGSVSAAIFLVSMGKGVCIAPRYAESLLSHDANFHIAISDRACGFDEYLYYNETGNSSAKLLFQEFSEQLQA